MGSGDARRAPRVPDRVGPFGLLDPPVACAARPARGDGPAFHAAGRDRSRVRFTGDPGLVRLDPRWHQAAWRFVRLGFEHILDGTDHLLFLLCLVIPLRRPRELILTVTAFTAGHSVTLIAAALNAGPDGLWLPPLVETLIAASIVYMAFENIVLAAREGGRPPAVGRRRWILALAFGLVHGLGFSFALRESLQFAGSHLLTSLLSFNAGVELGQLLVLDADGPRVAAPVPIRRGRADRRDPAVRARRAHRMALDRRSVGQPASVRVAGPRRRGAGVACQVRDGARGRGRRCVDWSAVCWGQGANTNKSGNTRG